MKIISDFHDYYDSVQKIDTDKMHTYVRKTSVVKLNRPIFKIENWHFEKLNRQTHMRDSINMHMFHLGFCGEIYTGVNVGKCILGKSTDSIHYGDLKKIKQLYERLEKPFAWNYSRYEGMTKHMLKRLTECFESNNINRIKELFLVHKVPAFIVLTNFKDDKYRFGHDQEVILNPNLKEMEFFKIKDIYTAYQDIAMYIGNNLVDDRNNAWPIEDKLKVQSHGFDQHSFRKEKLKKV